MPIHPVIAIIDDDADVRLGLANYFRAADLEARAFASADEFLASPERLATYCLITDLYMPALDGLALQRELNRAGHAFPVIVMTAFATEALRKEATLLGVAGFLEKPIDPDALLELIESALN